MVCYVYFSIIVRGSTVAGDVLSEILKLGVLLKLEEMFGTNVVNVQELQITGRAVSVLSLKASDSGSRLMEGHNLNF